MGLLDGILSSVLSPAASGTGASPMGQLLEGLLQQHGGLGGLVGQLSQGGLAEHVQSWVGTGSNLPVSAEQLVQALGSGRLAQLAQQVGIDPQHVGPLLAQVLPQVISHMTPNGQVPAGAAGGQASSLINAALGALAGRV